jgi:hypothetical protein
MNIREEKLQFLESERIETDSDGIQKVLAIIERIEGGLQYRFFVFVSSPQIAQ